MLTIDNIKKATQKIGQKYGIERAYLFGSYAKGCANDESDVDILIAKGKLRGIGMSRFRLDLMDELGGTEVDVLTEKSLRDKFFEFIKDDRVLIYGA